MAQGTYESWNVPPYGKQINHYMRFGIERKDYPTAEADAKAWAKANPHEGQWVSQAPNGTWIVTWSTKQ